MSGKAAHLAACLAIEDADRAIAHGAATRDPPAIAGYSHGIDRAGGTGQPLQFLARLEIPDNQLNRSSYLVFRGNIQVLKEKASLNDLARSSHTTAA